MDVKVNDTLQIKRKLSNTARKIRDNRKDLKKQKKEKLEFEEIKELLNSPAFSENELDVQDQVAAKSKAEIDPIIPISLITAPGLNIFEEEKLFSLFDEESLCLQNFIIQNEECTIFGEDSRVPNEDLFRDLIAHHTTEVVLPDKENCHLISLYVVYLMSVHTDKYFVSACLDFLKYRRFEISAAEILPIFVNFGCTLTNHIDSNIQITLPFKCNVNVKKKSFPYYNLGMVAEFLLYSAHLDLIKKEPELQILVRTLTKLTLDHKIRSSSLLSKFSILISVLSEKLADIFDVNEVISCLHLKDENILNQVEIARNILISTSVLYQSLFIKTIEYILKPKNLKLSTSLKIKDIEQILKELLEKKPTLLEIYCVLQLINSSLPSFTADVKDVGGINNLLVCLETSFFNVKDSVDLIRLKLEIAKLKNFFVLNSVENIDLMIMNETAILPSMEKKIAAQLN